MAKLTKSEFMKRYGHINVKFSHYNKFVFTYTNPRIASTGGRIEVNVGGNSEEIYREEVSVNEIMNVISLEPFSANVYDVDGNIVDEFYDY